MQHVSDTIPPTIVRRRVVDTSPTLDDIISWLPVGIIFRSNQVDHKHWPRDQAIFLKQSCNFPHLDSVAMSKSWLSGREPALVLPSFPLPLPLVLSSSEALCDPDRDPDREEPDSETSDPDESSSLLPLPMLSVLLMLLSRGDNKRVVGYVQLLPWGSSKDTGINTRKRTTSWCRCHTGECSCPWKNSQHLSTFNIARSI